VLVLLRAPSGRARDLESYRARGSICLHRIRADRQHRCWGYPGVFLMVKDQCIGLGAPLRAGTRRNITSPLRLPRGPSDPRPRYASVAGVWCDVSTHTHTHRVLSAGYHRFMRSWMQVSDGTRRHRDISVPVRGSARECRRCGPSVAMRLGSET